MNRYVMGDWWGQKDDISQESEDAEDNPDNESVRIEEKILFF